MATPAARVATVARQVAVAQGWQGAVWAGTVSGRETVWAQTQGRQGAVRVGAAEAG